MSSIFISYSSKDRSAAEEMYKRLTEKGYQSPFLDYQADSGIRAGADWERELYQHLKICKALIVLCSENWRQSQWSFAEVVYARCMGKDIFPVKISKCEIHPILGNLQVVDLEKEGQLGYERLWHGLEAARLSSQEDFEFDANRPPYPGLMAFDERDAGVYFGRHKEIQAVLDRLNQMRRRGEPRLLMIVGASGSGKSSLVRAGLVPRLKYKGAGGRWLVFPLFRWNDLGPKGQDWAERLASDLAAAHPAGPPHAPDWKALRSALSGASIESAAASFIDATKDLLQAPVGDGATPLLVIDQFEEVLVASANDSRSDPATAMQFMQFLRSLLTSPRCPWLCVVTVRSDFLASIQTNPALEGLPKDSYSLGLMAKESLSEVIRRPAERVGISFESDALVSRMVEDTATSDALPLLAFTLRELYERFARTKQFTLHQYSEELQGLEGCLRKAAEGLLRTPSNSAAANDKAERTEASDNPNERVLKECFLRCFVQVNDQGHFVRRPATWSELPEGAGPLLERFIERRLLIARGEGQDRIVEVAHEALFRVWDKLQVWLNSDREFLLWCKRFRAQLEEWKRADKSKHALLRGPILAEAQRWLPEHRNRFGKFEVQFIDLSVKAAKKQKRLKQLLIALPIITLVVAFAYPIWADWKVHARHFESAGQAFMKYQMQPALLSEALGDRTGAGTNDVDFLLLIGGGSYQPWGAGVLRGWHDNPENPRPKFQVVFGVNSGAVVATYAFLGERSDDDALEGMCLTGPDSFQAKPFTLPLVSDSIGSSSPLQQAITRYISPATLERVAKAGREEHRRLYVATVNMDSGRLVIWDLTSVAMDESNPARLALYRRIALASASLPILAPPVEIDGYFHADAGPRAGLCFEQFLPSILRWQRSELIHPPFTLHLILNGKLEAGSAPIGDSLKEISFRTLELLVDANKIEALYSVKRALASARYGKFQFCYVPQDLPVTGLGVLRQSSPRMLYDAGVAFGKRTRKMESLIPP